MTIDPQILFGNGPTTTFPFEQRPTIEGEFVECEVSDPQQVETTNMSEVLNDIEQLRQELSNTKVALEQLKAYVKLIATNVVDNKEEVDKKNTIFDRSFHDLNVRLNIVIVSVVAWIIAFVTYVIQK